jgi:hypothetical protein
MEQKKTRPLLLVLATLCVFVVVTAILLQLMPGPLKSMDYFVIGTVSTLMSLLALFLVIVSTSSVARNVFFKRRKKKT